MKNNKFVLGFAFDKYYRNVLLIEKNRPSWQKGKLNGIGGSIEINETPIETMIREFKEETGIVTSNKNWTSYCNLIFNDNQTVNLYFTNEIDIEQHNSITDEKLVIVSVDDILLRKHLTLSNVPWLILMILKKDFNCLNVFYNQNNG